MNYIREFLYRPKRSDRSLMARFFFADEALNGVASELDSFDGRKDPERCAALVHKLRGCQDTLLCICGSMLDLLEPGSREAMREFRAKFPDDILHDNLPGQLWFGAECLAAGSSILNKEIESEAMRPLAKAVTKSLERVRLLLREQCLRPNPEYSEKIRENLKIFDRLFSEFEFKYVQCMVHVKSIKEYELHQDIIILFSNTLNRSLEHQLVSQDMVEDCDPSLMFAIPRLAIVSGLLFQPEGPLNVDKGNAAFPELFLPFKNLLRKIRELLQTLEMSEVIVLEMLLCQLEEPDNLSRKLKEVQSRMQEDEKKNQAQKLQDKLDKRLPSEEVVVPILEAVISTVIDEGEEKKDEGLQTRRKSSSSPSSSSSSSSSSGPLDCPLKRVNARRGDPKRRRIPYKFQKDKRARFKSTEDLLHRLYVCISGAADQLQSNYAGDFRSILKAVFLMNSACEEEGSIAIEGGEEEPYAIDWGTDALREEEDIEEMPSPGSSSGHRLQNEYHHLDVEDEEPSRHTYARNIIQDEASGGVSGVAEGLLPAAYNPEGFYRDEPALMNIARGDRPEEDDEFLEPPAWVPDEAAPICMGCQDPFTLFKRRHHCRSCGLVFCYHCSGQSVPLPQYGIDKPVRVCNRCYYFYKKTSHRNGSHHSSRGSGGTSGSLWSRHFGMVS
eukprot:TRINITY_DN4485_c0_g1_i1.p1 TRINITY_DN4485_c0_g1~~TRINITY_DN4485_c0_g1_i1.p1  ORF type:complete len:669 (-),score=206.20 TRINITY_DN4485_c0_g1_i1:1457-3463(-)